MHFLNCCNESPFHNFANELLYVRRMYTFSCFNFQVDRAGFQDTKDVRSHPSLARKYDQIKREFGFDWRDVQWSDLRNDPVKSGVAARLYLSNKPGAIPSDLDGQARYWKDNYNTNAGAGTVEKFKSDVRSMP